MRQRKEDKGQDKDKETLFDRLLREKRMKKLLVPSSQNCALSKILQP